MKIVSNFFLLIFVISSSLSFAQTKQIQLQLDGKKYETMYLKAELYGLANESLDIKGQSEDGSNWKFTIPDSIVSHAQWYNVQTGEYDSEQKKVFRLNLVATLGKDTIKGSMGRLLFRYDEKMPVLQMKYIKSEVVDVSNYRVNDSLVMEKGQVVYDQFLLSPIVKGSDFEIGLENPRVSTPYFYDDDPALIYALDSLSQKHSDSHFLMMQASVYAISRANKEEIKKIYNNFSKANKDTYWGKRMKKYLDAFQFQNMMLPTTGNLKKEEPIIVDSTKYNLIVFSASWCGPCRAEIPVLKQMYNDLKERLNIVYVSIDEKGTVAAWQKLVQTETIPWRSLNAYKDVDKVQGQYNMLFGIPYNLLVFPDGKAELIDVRKAEDKQQLYRLVSGSSN